MDVDDGYYEKWYELVINNKSFHMLNDESEITEIKYYFSLYSNDFNMKTWFSESSIELGNSIILGYKESMGKWNNVYYYVLNDL